MEERSAVPGEDAWNDLYLVIEGGIGEDLETGTHGATFGIVRAVDEARDAGLDDGAGAHAAGLKCDVQCSSCHAIVFEESGGFANYNDLGVSCWIAVADCAVTRAREDSAVVNDESANGDFPGGRRAAGFLDGELHKRIVDFHLDREDNMRREVETKNSLPRKF